MKKLFPLYLLIVFMTTALITGCAQNKSDQDKVNPNESSLTLLLMNDELWLSFYTITGSNLKFMLPNELFQVLNAAKEEKGKELNLIIRTSDKVQKATIDTIVEMIKSSGISKYFITKMSDEELETIMTAVANFRKPSELVLTMPKDEPEEDAVQEEKNCITVILLEGDDCWCYQDTNISSGTLYNIKEFQRFMSEKKKEFGDSILVIIKPTAQATYKATVDALDQMTINQIKRYAMVKLHEGEERFLFAKGLIELQEPVKIKTPITVATREIPHDNTFIIEIRKDNSVFYQFMSLVNKMGPQKVNEPITKNLKEIIADYEKSLPDKPKNYLIKGDSKSTYPTFEKVINALKENKVYKYNLVTEAGQQKEPGLLMPRKEN
jgi:biopolymer transport protein ExbD